MLHLHKSSSAQHNHIALHKISVPLNAFGGDGIHVRSLEVCEMDKMENGLGEDGGEWGRRNVVKQMCNCGLWLNLIFLRDRLIRKVFCPLYIQLSGKFTIYIYIFLFLINQYPEFIFIVSVLHYCTSFTLLSSKVDALVCYISNQQRPFDPDRYDQFHLSSIIEPNCS